VRLSRSNVRREYPDAVDTTALAVRDNERELRYELTRDGEVLGFLNYRRDPERGRVELVHTDIEPAYEGHGLGSLLVKGAGRRPPARPAGRAVLPVRARVPQSTS
jgi:predicted GNAT family acetyltransferase